MLFDQSMGHFAFLHPHTRGDNVVASDKMRREAGSPPHAWGQSGQVFRGLAGARFTPTRVGTISRAFFSSSWRFGSPPHAWGQLEDDVKRELDRRFTPTRVGTIALYV